MKSLTCHLLLLIVALSLNTLQSKASDDDKEPVAAAEACIMESSLSNAEVKFIEDDFLFSLQYPEPSHNVKCFVLCVYKKFGIVQPDGSKKLDVVQEYFEEKFPEKKDVIKAALDKCDGIRMANSCDEIYAFESCIWKSLAM